MMKLFLDDVRIPPEDSILLKNHEEFIKWISENGLPEYISFDHDLGKEKTGYDCAKFLIDFCLDNEFKLPDFFVHSQNLVGKENIQCLLDNFKNFQY